LTKKQPPGNFGLRLLAGEKKPDFPKRPKTTGTVQAGPCTGFRRQKSFAPGLPFPYYRGIHFFLSCLIQDHKTHMSPIRLLPGLIAALVAYLALPLLSWLGYFPARLLVFILIYIGVTLVLDIAMKRYRG
jgi:hypothetical protein